MEILMHFQPSCCENLGNQLEMAINPRKEELHAEGFGLETGMTHFSFPHGFSSALAY